MPSIEVLIYALIILIVVVGGYVYLFLNVMRMDPKERQYREQKGQDNTIIPAKESKDSN